jgi:GLPGLI family protein
MKRILFVMIAGLVVQVSAAQVQDGKIVYERKANMHKRLSAEQENLKNMIPEFDVSKVELIFSGHESIYRRVQEEEDIRETAGEPGDRQVFRMRIGGDNQLYKNYTTMKAAELTELGPKKYVIEDSVRVTGWKLDESETKQVKGYTCKKATATLQNGRPVVAWYTEQILSPSGPENWGGLPGMILELNMGDGEMIFTAIEVSDKGDKKLVSAPTGGKKITRKEYQKMLEEQFGVSPNGGGPMIRVIRQ